MGIKSFFSKDGRHSRQIGRWARTVANPKAAGEDRWAAMLELAKEGSSEALMALLMRYTYTADVGTRSRVTDEQEKAAQRVKQFSDDYFALTRRFGRDLTQYLVFDEPVLVNLESQAYLIEP